MQHEPWIDAACQWLKLASDDAPTSIISRSIVEAEPADLESLLDRISEEFEEYVEGPKRLRLLMQLVATRLQQLLAVGASGTPELGNQALLPPELLGRCYDQALAVDDFAAAHLLQMLSLQGDEGSIDTLADAMTGTPPAEWQAVGVGLSPLWNASGEKLEYFFDRLGDGLVHPTSMAVLLDLANFAVRGGRIDEHPWQRRGESLATLLESVIRQLERLEQDPSQFGDSIEAIQRTLSDSVALVIALCDSLGLIGNPAAIAKLTHAMGLSHRRIQTEAAGALARLGDESGRQRLVELASDLVARRRAVAYAEEVECVDQIDEELRTPVALAESELASWLAEPEQYGLPPTGLELVDATTQYWPSYEEPRECYLFRYWYDFPSGQVSNIGIAGPVAHAFQSDLGNLPVDDIYAAFAGWHAEHEGIYEIPSNLLNPAQRREADALIARLEGQDYEVQELLALTFLLGELSVLTRTQHDDKPAITLSDQQETLSFPAMESPTAITPEIVLAIYRGRKLLRTFNF